MCERTFCNCDDCRNEAKKVRDRERPYLVAKYGKKPVEHWDKLYKERSEAIGERT